jgi:hypothetical protein
MDLPYQPNTPFSQSDHSTHQYNALRFFYKPRYILRWKWTFLYLLVIPNSSRYLIPPVIREYPNPLYASLGILLCFISAKNIFNSTCHYMMNSGPFAEGGPSKNTKGIAFTCGYTLFKCFLSSKKSTSDATVGKSSPLYSVNFVLILSFSLIEVRK